MARKHSSSHRSKKSATAAVTSAAVAGPLGTKGVALAVSPNGTVVGPPGPPPLDTVEDDSIVFFTESGHFEKEQVNLYMKRILRERAVMALVAIAVISGGLYYWKVVLPRRRTTASAVSTEAPIVDTSAPKSSKLALILSMVALAIVIIGLMIWKRRQVVDKIKKEVERLKEINAKLEKTKADAIATREAAAKKKAESNEATRKATEAAAEARKKKQEAEAARRRKETKEAQEKLDEEERKAQERAKQTALDAKKAREAQLQAEKDAADAKQAEDAQEAADREAKKGVAVKDRGVFTAKADGVLNGMTYKKGFKFHAIAISDGIQDKLHFVHDELYGKVFEPLVRDTITAENNKAKWEGNKQTEALAGFMGGAVMNRLKESIAFAEKGMEKERAKRIVGLDNISEVPQSEWNIDDSNVKKE